MLVEDIAAQSLGFELGRTVVAVVVAAGEIEVCTEAVVGKAEGWRYTQEALVEKHLVGCILECSFLIRIHQKLYLYCCMVEVDTLVQLCTTMEVGIKVQLCMMLEVGKLVQLGMTLEVGMKVEVGMKAEAGMMVEAGMMLKIELAVGILVEVVACRN